MESQLNSGAALLALLRPVIEAEVLATQEVNRLEASRAELLRENARLRIRLAVHESSNANASSMPPWPPRD